MEKRHRIVLVVLAVVLVLAALGTGYMVYTQKHAVSEEALLAFSNTPGEAPYSDMLGNAVSLETHLGKVLVVATWASWSPFSAGDLTMLNALAEEFSADTVVFMAINRKESKEQAARFMTTQPEFKNLLMVLDPRDHFYTTVGGYAMPEVVVYSKRGEVVLHERGLANKDEIATAVKDALAAQ